jgi:hypothetical protein
MRRARPEPGDVGDEDDTMSVRGADLPELPHWARPVGSPPGGRRNLESDDMSEAPRRARWNLANLKRWWVWRPIIPRVLISVVLVVLGHTVSEAAKRHDLKEMCWLLVGGVALLASVLLSDAGWEVPDPTRRLRFAPFARRRRPERSDTPPS